MPIFDKTPDYYSAVDTSQAVTLDTAKLKEALRRIHTSDAGDPLSSSRARLRMIGMRLRLAEGSLWPWPFIETHATEDKVLVFLVVKGKPVILEDDKSLFPSDTLVTQLRLLE